jgi:hypothetical protein
VYGDLAVDPTDFNTYYCIDANTNEQPSTASSFWVIFYSLYGSGNTGPTGPAGGPTGSTGPPGLPPAVLTDNFTVIGTSQGLSPIFYSYDGLTFLASSSAPANAFLGGAINNIAYNGNHWLAVGALPSNAGGCILYSLDGVNWMTSDSAGSLTTGIVSGINSVAWGGNKWIAITGAGSAQNSMIYSYDGNAWYASANGNAAAILAGSTNILSIAYNGNTWFASVNSAGAGIYSTDGVNWEVANTSAAAGSNTILSVASNGSLFVATAGIASAVVIYSYDGNNWEVSATGSTIFSSGFAKVASNGFMWVAGSTQYILGYSYDGINWTQSAQGSSLITNNGGITNLSLNGTTWIGVGLVGGTFNLVYSTDGITWSTGVVSGTNPGTTTFNASASRRCLPFIGTNLQGNFQAAPTGPTGSGAPSSYFLNTANANLYRYQGTGWTGISGLNNYVPTVSANWTGTAPTTITEALDRLAAGLVALNIYP